MSFIFYLKNKSQINIMKMEELIKNGDLENIKKLLESDDCKYNDNYLWWALKYRQPECILYLFDYEDKNKRKYSSGGIFDGEEFLSEWPCTLLELVPPLENEEVILKKCLEQLNDIKWLNQNVIGSVLSMNKFTLLKTMYKMGALDKFLNESGYITQIICIVSNHITNKEMVNWILEKCRENYDITKDCFIGCVFKRIYKDDSNIYENEIFNELVKNYGSLLECNKQDIKCFLDKC